ncbi:MAG: hypothetical protein N4A54_04150 [Peptostreptococcaceae bacterium]|jgi:hypothetical protein|nr:hypothetical protein [Peptostreptococcaceae bacterium]
MNDDEIYQKIFKARMNKTILIGIVIFVVIPLLFNVTFNLMKKSGNDLIDSYYQKHNFHYKQGVVNKKITEGKLLGKNKIIVFSIENKQYTQRIYNDDYYLFEINKPIHVVFNEDKETQEVEIEDVYTSLDSDSFKSLLKEIKENKSIIKGLPTDLSPQANSSGKSN